MNCTRCQRLLLGLPDPGSPPPEAALHMAGCLPCREFLERMTQIEANVHRLPTPPSNKKAEVVQFFLNPGTPGAEQGPPHGAPARPTVASDVQQMTSRAVPSKGERIRRWGLVAAAAAIIVAAGIWTGNWASRALRPEQPLAKTDKDKTPSPEKDAPPPKALAAMVLECDLELAETRDAIRRVEILAKLAGSLRDESSWLASTPAEKELKALARLHGRVVKEGLLPRAKEVAPADRRRALAPIADRLSEAHRSIKTLAPKVDAELGRPLEEIALAADSAARTLRELMDEYEATP